MKRMVLGAACGLVVLGVAAGFWLSRRAGWQPVGAMDTGAVPTQLAKAEAARKELAETLQKALLQAMQDGGPERAIAVWRDEAQALTQKVSQTHGLKIGRTSFKLRNPQNTSPDWALPAIAARTTERRILRGPKGEVGVVWPIKLTANCLLCHGAPDQIAPEVRSVLSQAYPADQATGFADGDLRGWFWAEVPPLAR